VSSTNTVVAVGVTPEKLANVRKWNIGLTVLHLGQAAAVLLLTNDFAIKILDSTPAGPPGTEGLVTSTLFEVRIGWVMAAFLALAGLDHLLTSTFARNTYESDLKNGINRFRWAEYSIIAISLLVGKFLCRSFYNYGNPNHVSLVRIQIGKLHLELKKLQTVLLYAILLSQASFYIPAFR